MKALLVVAMLLLPVAGWGAGKKPLNNDAKKVAFDVDSCVDQAIDFGALLATNPYDNVGKCYLVRVSFPMVKHQLLSRSVALIGLDGSQNILALMDFGKESVPMGRISGLVMGMGAYEYETVYGSKNTVHHLKKLDGYLKRTKKQQAEKDVIDKIKAVEQARLDAEHQKATDLALKEAEIYSKEMEKKKEENETERIREAERQEALKQHDILEKARYQTRKAEMDKLVRTEKADGLMWTRDANIAGKTMTWNDAMVWVKQFSHAGYSDWRLPTQKELTCIPNNNYYSTSYISNVQGYYWSSNEENLLSAWALETKYGKFQDKFKIFYLYVWPVRTIKSSD